MKSDVLKTGIDTIPHRALLAASGVRGDDLLKPFIGVANSFNTIVPGHVHLDALASEVERGIRNAGGVPFKWGVPAVCDGIAMNVEMRLSLPSREHIADNIELMTLSHSMDGWVGITNCDKITPGMLMAAMRLNLPAILLTGGPMMAGGDGDEKLDLISCFEDVGKVRAGALTEEAANRRAECACPGPGSCAGLFTANTMAILTEAMGMSLSGSATPPAVSDERKQIAYETGRRAVELVERNIRARDILTEATFRNGFTVDLAVGGSTNTTLHIPAIAAEGGIVLSVQELNELSMEVPNICHLRPGGTHHMEDLNRAGGVPAVLHRLHALLEDVPTVNGVSIGAIAKEAKCEDDEVIRPLSRPYSEEGGIAVLSGNLADESVVKQSAVNSEMLVHSGPAKVFFSEQDVLDGIRDGNIEEGDVVVLPFQGAAGAPGMPEMLTPTAAVMGAGFERVALVTDGRFSGGTRGPCIGHVLPEAFNRGPIGAVRDGDIIEIDIPSRRLNVRLTPDEVSARLADTTPPNRTMTPMLVRYRERFNKAPIK